MRKIVLTVFFAITAITFAAAQAPSPRVMSEFSDPAKDVQVFPNPVIDYVHVKIESIRAENVKVTLHNILGTEVAAEKESVNEHELKVWVKDLSAGYYFLALKDEESGLHRIYKIVKR